MGLSHQILNILVLNKVRMQTLIIYSVVLVIYYTTFTLNKYPTNADSPIAIVPQNVILIIALLMLEPPVFAASAPNTIRKKRANP